MAEALLHRFTHPRVSVTVVDTLAPVERERAEFVVLVGKSDLLKQQEPAALMTRLIDGPVNSTLTESGKTLAVVPIPAEVSRHNCYARPDAITPKIRAIAPSRGTVSIVVYLDEAHTSYAEAVTSAVARAFPIYDHSRREAGASPVEVRVAFSLPVDVQDLQNVSDAVRFASLLVDAPTSELHTDSFSDIARDVARRLGCDIRVISETLEQEGYGGFVGVGKAAPHPPALVILSHNGTAAAKKNVILCGKGIVYDTGGLSIKMKDAMPGMKRDMAGAAGLLAAFEILVKRRFPHNLHCLLCLAENSVDSVSTRNDDILEMFSGLTVEINNTDAEGRLVLADGVAHACKFLDPHVIIDMATLTGAQGTATGRRHAAIVSNDEELERVACEAGRLTGDLVHPLLYCPEFLQPDFKSEVADMKNSSKDAPMVGSAVAAQFIASHMDPAFFQSGGKWLHIDMAYPSFSGERATGFGTILVPRLLTNLLGE